MLFVTLYFSKYLGILSSEDLGSIPGLGRSPGEGKGYPLQYSGLKHVSLGPQSSVYCQLGSCHIESTVSLPFLQTAPLQSAKVDPMQMLPMYRQRDGNQVNHPKKKPHPSA